MLHRGNLPNHPQNYEIGRIKHCRPEALETQYRPKFIELTQKWVPGYNSEFTSLDS